MLLTDLFQCQFDRGRCFDIKFTSFTCFFQSPENELVVINRKDFQKRVFHVVLHKINCMSKPLIRCSKSCSRLGNPHKDSSEGVTLSKEMLMNAQGTSMP